MKTIFLLLFGLQYAFANPIQTLISNNPINNHVEKSEKKFYKITVPKNKTLRVKLTNLQADVDLYVKKGDTVRIKFNDCYSSKGRTSDEECLVTNEGESSQYTILVYGFRESDYRVNAIIEDAEQITNLTKDVAVHDSVEYKGQKIYKYLIKKDKPTTITLSDLTADADLRIKLGKRVNLNTFDCKSTNGGTKVDECTITSKTDDTLYIQVYGYRSANYSLKVSYGLTQEEKDRLINKAKEYCQNDHQEENRWTEIVCGEFNNTPIAYLVTNKSLNYSQSDSSLYAINLTENRESINTIYKNNHSIDIKQLSNSGLVALLSSPRRYVKTVSVYNFYGKRVLSKEFKEPNPILNSVTSKDSKLFIDYTYNFNSIEFRDTYDIHDTSKITLISHTKKDKDIADYVKNICTNHIRDNKVICLEEFNRAYYMEEESNENPMGYHLLHIVNTESSKWREVAKKPFGDEYTPTIKKLENTPLVLITTYHPHSSDAHIYYNDPKTNSFKDILSLHQDDSIKIDGIKTTNSGKVLSIKSHHDGSGENFDALYDIAHLPKITLIK